MTDETGPEEAGTCFRRAAGARIMRAMSKEAVLVRRAAMLAALAATLTGAAACRQLAGIQPLPKPCADPLMIDDMEDGNPRICESQGRHGGWYSFGDGTNGTQMLAPNETIPGGRGASRKAVHFTGGGFTGWGAVAAFNFDDQGLGRNLYKANSAGGLTFWMKSTTPVMIQLQIPATSTIADGGDCVAGASPNNCNNSFAFVITAPDGGWTQHKIPFTALRQLQPGTATWDPTQLLNTQFMVGPGAAFDVWIDDVAFYYCASTECAPTCTDPAFSVACVEGTRHRAGCYPTGTDCAAIDTWCGDPMLIDDMEDGDNEICLSGGRSGTWWSTSDGTSTDLTPAMGSVFTQTLIPGGRGTSHVAARLAGSGFTQWGGQMAFDFVKGNGNTYDASAADGITFWMKTDAGGFDFAIDTPETITPPDGSCMDTATALNCNRSWHFWVAAPAPDTWFQVAVPFAALAQMPGVSPTTNNLLRGSATWDPTKLSRVKFTANTADSFELWVDDVRFYNCPAGGCVPTCSDPASPVGCVAAAGQPAACWPAGTNCSNPRPGPSLNQDVWGSGRNDVWVAGVASDWFAGTVFHWDGSSWTSKDVGPAYSFSGVSGQGAGDVWAVGDHGEVVRWDGSSWSSTTAETDASLSNVWVNGPDDAWVIAYPGTLLHWDGLVWSTGFSTTKWTIGLWGSAPNNLWAVGDGGTILHYDGGWSAWASPTTVFLNRVWGTAANDVWAVGDSGPILHFDGTTWAPSPGITGGYLGVWASSPANAWAVGYAGAIAHWDGARWSTVTSPTSSHLYAVWGSGPDDVWAVGAMPTVLHYDGRVWTVVAIVGQSP